MTDVRALGRIKNVPLASIRPYPGNARKIPQKAVDQCAESLREFGWQQPIVTDDDMVVVVGHTRLRAAEKLGLASAPVHVASYLSPDQVRAYRIADNRTHDYSTWDYGQLAKELTGLDEEFADVLDLADWQGIIAEFERQGAEASGESGPVEHGRAGGGPGVLDEETGALLSGAFEVRLIFASRAEADKAGPALLEIPGVVNVRYAR